MAKFNIAGLLRKKPFRSLTGVTPDQFLAMSNKNERDYNHGLSRFRVRVEHAIARLKAFRVLADRYRYPRDAYAAKFAIVAGIVNLVAGF